MKRIALCLLLVPSLASAATRTWSGLGGDANWLTAANWDAAVAAGDALIFPDGAAQLTNTNNFPVGTSFASITFSGPAGGYTLGGNSIVLKGTITSNDSTTLNRINFGIDFDGGTLTVDTTQNGGWLRLQGVLSAVAAGNLIKNGIGLCQIGGVNTYSGTTTVNQGYLSPINNSALGAGDGTAATGTLVNNGGTIYFDTVTIANEALIINGLGQNNNGALGSTTATLNGPISFPAGTGRIAVLSPNVMTINGLITGVGLVQFNSNGTLILANSSNTFGGGFTLGGGAGQILRLGANNALNNVALDVIAGATFDLNGFSDNLTSLSGAGNLTLGSGGQLTDAQPGITTFSGPIAGNGNFIKSGAGALTLSGTDTHTGVANVQLGRLLVTGTIVSASMSVTATGILGGTGSVPGITVGTGTIAPGLSPGIFSSGGLALNGGAFVVELNGATAGSGYDQLNVTGAVVLAPGTLSASLGFSPAPGTQFTIINNDGVDPVNGTFAGLPQGAPLLISGTAFTIGYTGGDGNDVVLTVGDGIGVPTMGPITLVATMLMLFAGSVWLLRGRSRQIAQT